MYIYLYMWMVTCGRYSTLSSFFLVVLALIIISACRLGDYVSTHYSVVDTVGTDSRWFLIS